MREEDSILFKKMLNEFQKEEEFSKAFHVKGEYNSTTESLALIFQQQKMIRKLIDELSKYK